jgi:hypothetical protein
MAWDISPKGPIANRSNCASLSHQWTIMAKGAKRAWVVGHAGAAAACASAVPHRHRIGRSAEPRAPMERPGLGRCLLTRATETARGCPSGPPWPLSRGNCSPR